MSKYTITIGDKTVSAATPWELKDLAKIVFPHLFPLKPEFKEP